MAMEPVRAEPSQNTARLNLRLPVSLLDMIRQAATLADLDQSEWCRSALLLQVRKDLRPEHIATVVRTRTLLVVEAGVCIHPTQYRDQVGVHRICRACGTVLETL